MVISEISAPNQIADRQSYNSAVKFAFSEQLTLKTKEGDLVDLSFENQSSLAESETRTRLVNGEVVQEFSSVAVAASRYSITVRGDLNDEELKAIQAIVDGISPLARQFAANAEFDFEKSGQILANSLGVIEEVEIKLERVLTAAFSAETYFSRPSAGPQELETLNDTVVPQDPIDSSQIRSLPELVLAAVEAEFEAQVENSPRRESILRSLNDLMQFLRENLNQFFNPLDHTFESEFKPLPTAAGSDSFSRNNEKETDPAVTPE